MAEIQDVPLADDWLDLNTYTGIAVGTAMNIQNDGAYHFRIQESSTEPVSENEGFRVTTLGADYAAPTVRSGSLKIWVRCVSPAGTIIKVQEIA